MSLLPRLYDALALDDPSGPADAIFAFAGAQPRKEYARRLFEEGLAPELILSIGRFEWRRVLAMGLPHEGRLAETVATVSPPDRHFFLRIGASGGETIRVPRRRFGTWSEACGLAALGRERGYRSLLVISDAPHLRRVRLALRRAFGASSPAIRYVAVPEEIASAGREGWWRHRPVRRVVLGELVKLPIYALLLPSSRSGMKPRP